MKINSLYISAFGGIKNLKLNFTDGFNVIYGDNENGKTTVMTFIKMMFYGSERGSAQISKNIRKKYTPWDNSQMAGSIDFEHSGKKYRIEREFRTTNSTDKVTLFDVAMGTKKTVSGDVGTEFFGMSAPAFERSVFIGQLGFPEQDSTAFGEINSKLSNISLTGDENISFEAVKKRLEKAKFALMSKGGKSGLYDKNISACLELKNRIDKATADNQNINAEKLKVAELERELASMQKEAVSLKSKINQEQDVKNAEKLKNLLEIKEKLDSLNNKLTLQNGEIADEMFLRKIQFCLSKTDSTTTKINAKTNEIEVLKKSINAGLNPPKDANLQTAQDLKTAITALENRKISLDEELTKLSDEKALLTAKTANIKKQSKPKTITFAICAIFSAVIAFFVLSTFLKFTIAAVLSAVFGVAALAIVFLLSATAHKNKNSVLQKVTHLENIISDKEKYNQTVKDELFAKKVKLESINAALNSTASVMEKQRELLNLAQNELDILNTNLNNETDELFGVFSVYKTAMSITDIKASLSEISENCTEVKQLKQQINFLLNDLGGISYASAYEKLQQIETQNIDLSADFETIKLEFDRLISDISEKKSLLAALQTEVKSLQSSTENTEVLNAQLKNLYAKTLSQKEFCEATDIALQTLQESYTEVRSGYSIVLEKNAGEIFSLLTNQKYSNMSVSDDFDINVNEQNVFGSHDIAYLSSGTEDQAYLSLRLALSKLLCNQNENLPILLDDALTQYDDTRMKNASVFLKSYSAENQIIMFTCHKNIYDTAKLLGAECKTL